MTNILESIVESCKYVVDSAKHVKINYDKIDDLISNIDITRIKYWLNSNPFDILSFDVETIINFLLVYHTIGDYCFWGDPKWEIETEMGKMDGSYAMMYLLINRLKFNKDYNLSFTEFKKLLSGNIEIPLLRDRYNNLKIMNEFLEKQDKDFYNLVKSFTKDTNLFNYLITNLKYFIDESVYKNNRVYYYKRAQLLTSDILHIREIKKGIQVDYSHLVGCADYKIPQVMRCYGILEFDEELSSLVDNKIPITIGSEMENEIRASDIIVIDFIANKFHNEISRIDINDYFWLLSQDKSKMNKPYHRTLTNKY